MLHSRNATPFGLREAEKPYPLQLPRERSSGRREANPEGREARSSGRSEAGREGQEDERRREVLGVKKGEA